MVVLVDMMKEVAFPGERSCQGVTNGDKEVSRIARENKIEAVMHRSQAIGVG